MTITSKDQLEKRKEKARKNELKLALDKQRIREAERKLQTKERIELGAIIEKSKVNALDRDEILGALLEIKEKSKEEAKRKEWRQRTKDLFRKERPRKDNEIVVSFAKPSSSNVRKKLKSNDFKWDSWYKEWRGHGPLEDIEKMFEGENVTIKKIKD